MKTVYFVLMDAIKGDPTWDTFCGAFASHADALETAEFEWGHLTDREQCARRVSVNHGEAADGLSLEEAAAEIMESGGGWVEDEVFTHD